MHAYIHISLAFRVLSPNEIPTETLYVNIPIKVTSLCLEENRVFSPTVFNNCVTY